MVPRINTIQAKTIFTKSGLPGSDWVINPYNGCLFGCMYCYAAQIARWKHPDEEWGSYLDVKINAPELLKKELEKLEKKLKTKDFGSVFFSSVTDPLNVARYNEPAIGFYEKFGFAKTGRNGALDSAAKLPSGKFIPEIEMARVALARK